MNTVQVIHLAASVFLLCAAFMLIRHRVLARGKGRMQASKDISARLIALEERLDVQLKTQIDLMNDQNRKLAKIESQISTLADERLVEQAISVAKMGGNPEHISTAVGLSLDEARTLHRFRSN